MLKKIFIYFFKFYFVNFVAWIRSFDPISIVCFTEQIETIFLYIMLTQIFFTFRSFVCAFIIIQLLFFFFVLLHLPYEIVCFYVFTKTERMMCMSLDYRWCGYRRWTGCRRTTCTTRTYPAATVRLLLCAKRLVKRWRITLREIQFRFHNRSHSWYQIGLFVH